MGWLPEGEGKGALDAKAPCCCSILGDCCGMLPEAELLDEIDDKLLEL